MAQERILELLKVKIILSCHIIMVVGPVKIGMLTILLEDQVGGGSRIGAEASCGAEVARLRAQLRGEGTLLAREARLIAAAQQVAEGTGGARDAARGRCGASGGQVGSDGARGRCR